MSFLRALLLVATCYQVVMATDYARCDFERFGYFFFKGNGNTLHRSGSFKVERHRKYSRFVNFNLYKSNDQVDSFATCLERVNKSRLITGVSRYGLNGERRIVEFQEDTSHLGADLRSLRGHVILASFEGSSGEECCVMQVDDRYKTMMEMFEADQAVTQGNSLEILYPGSVQPTGQPTAKPTAKPTQSPVPPTQSPYHPRPYAQCVFVEGNVRSTTYLFELSNKEIRVDGFGLVLLKFKADLVKHTDQCVYNPEDLIQHLLGTTTNTDSAETMWFKFSSESSLEELAGNTLLITDDVRGTEVTHCCQVTMVMTQQMIDERAQKADA